MINKLILLDFKNSCMIYEFINRIYMLAAGISMGMLTSASTYIHLYFFLHLIKKLSACTKSTKLQYYAICSKDH